jgi:hypothetical protein
LIIVVAVVARWHSVSEALRLIFEASSLAIIISHPRKVWEKEKKGRNERNLRHGE